MRDSRRAAGRRALGCTPGPVDVATIAPASLANGLVAHWTFDETAGRHRARQLGQRPRRQHLRPRLELDDRTLRRRAAAVGRRSGHGRAAASGFRRPPPTTPCRPGCTSRPPTCEPPVAAVLSNEIPWGVGPPGGWSLSLDVARPRAQRREGDVPLHVLVRAGRTRRGRSRPTCACVVVRRLDAPGRGDRRDGGNADVLRRRARAPAGARSRAASGRRRARCTWGAGRRRGASLTGMLDDVAIYSRALVPEEIALARERARARPDVTERAAPIQRRYMFGASRSRCMRMCAASTAVLASAIARSNAARASSWRPSCGEQRAAHAEEMKVAGQLRRERLDQRERLRRAAQLRDRDGAVERHHRRRRQPLERRVERVDLRPVGRGGGGRAIVQRRDRRLHLVGAGTAVAHRLVEQRDPFGDRLAIPARRDPDPRAARWRRRRRGAPPRARAGAAAARAVPSSRARRGTAAAAGGRAGSPRRTAGRGAAPRRRWPSSPR